MIYLVLRTVTHLVAKLSNWFKFLRYIQLGYLVDTFGDVQQEDRLDERNDNIWSRLLPFHSIHPKLQQFTYIGLRDPVTIVKGDECDP